MNDHVFGCTISESLLLLDSINTYLLFCTYELYGSALVLLSLTARWKRDETPNLLTGKIGPIQGGLGGIENYVLLY